MPKNKKESTKRSRDKYRALKPELNLKIRYEEIADVAEYANKLNPEDKAWLNKFMDEYTNDVLDRKNLKKNLHNTKKLKQDCDARNNARNRDLYSKLKAGGNTIYLEDLYEEELVQREDEFFDTEESQKDASDDGDESDCS